MSQLIDISGYWIDPVKVTSVHYPLDGSNDVVLIHVDQNTWDQVFTIDIDPGDRDGWDLDRIAYAINAGRL